MKQTKALSAIAITVALLAPSIAQAEDLTLWTIEEQPERLAKQEELAKQFTASSGHNVKVIPVSEKDLGVRTTAAFAAGELPDIIYHPLQYVLPWAQAGILDTDASQEVIEALGANTFSPGPLRMADFDGYAAAVPVDGWSQMIVYRKDLFAEKGLEAPTTYAKLQTALKALHNPPELYGFVAATKVDESFMSQVLEHVLLANGVTPVDKNGIKLLDKKKASEAFEFYKTLAKASPPGELYWKQSRELYFSGKAAMIIWSPFILDELAGLRDSAPPTINQDPKSRELADKTLIVTNFAGPSNPKGAAWADVRYLGITSDASTEEAQEFIKFSMSDGYTKTLSIAPEGKFPVRRGTKENPSLYTDAWAKLPVGVDRKAPLGELYPQSMIKEIVAGLDTAQRWGVNEGQLALASKVVNSKVFNRVIREYMDDSITVEQAVDKINAELKSL